MSYVVYNKKLDSYLYHRPVNTGGWSHELELTINNGMGGPMEKGYDLLIFAFYEGSMSFVDYEYVLSLISMTGNLIGDDGGLDPFCLIEIDLDIDSDSEKVNIVINHSNMIELDDVDVIRD